MTNYVNKQVLRLIGITDPNQITSDEQYVLGTITREIGPKVRVVWNEGNLFDSVEYLDKRNLTGWDKTTFTVTALESDNSDNSDSSDSSDVSRETGESDKSDTSVSSNIAAQTDEPVGTDTQHKADNVSDNRTDAVTSANVVESDKPVKATRTRTVRGKAVEVVIPTNEVNEGNGD